MKKILYNLSLTCFLAVALAFVAHANEQKMPFGPKQEFSKIIYKEFNINPYGTTQLINKYGRIDARTWDGNQVKIKVTIVANSYQQSDAEKIFNRINISFYNDANFVKAETQISEQSNWGWNNNKNNDFSINYEVYYPKGNFLDLSNRYGDSYVGFTMGAVKANIKYGNLRTDDIHNNLELSLQYGDGRIGNVKKDLKTYVDYSKLFVKSADKFKFNGDYSEVEVEYANDAEVSADYTQIRGNRIGSLACTADYGNIKVQTVNNFNFKGDYSDIYINTVSNFVKVEMDYGGFTVDRVAKDFSEININAEYTGVKVGVEDGANYRLDADSDYGDMKMPLGFNITNEDESGTSSRIKGFLGSSNAKSVMKFDINYGELKIK